MAKKQVINQGVALEEREKRGLSKVQMADVLGIDGSHGEQVLTDFETGFRPVKGSVLRIYESLNRGRWFALDLLQLSRWSVVLKSQEGECTIHHNEWPRFVARAFADEMLPQQWRFKKADMPVFAMDERTGYRQLVIAFVDHVPDDYDPEDLVVEAIRHLEEKIMNDKKHG